MAIVRSTAYRVRIKNLIEGEFLKQEGFNPSYIIINGNQVSRVNLIASVIGKYSTEDNNFATVTLDDGSETIRVKAFSTDVPKLKDIKLGDLIRFIGKVKHYNDETYLTPEVLQPNIDPNWLIVDKLELETPSTELPSDTTESKSKHKIETTSEETTKEELEIIEVKAEEDNPNLEILALVKKLDSGDGAPMDQIISTSNLSEEQTKDSIVGLLKMGEIFEPKKGILKVLD
tara:strand:- start:1769 stop:2461 length:693 start_codon:yes stop_codon:yes gene_type:complete